MATYLFSTITASQAAALTADDTVTFDVGTATDAAVIYAGPNEIDVILGGRTVAFDLAISSVSLAGRTVFADGAKLFIGDDAANKFGGADAEFGGAGNDTISGGGLGHALIQGNAGDDSITAFASGFATVYGGQGNDDIILLDFAPQPGGTRLPLGSNFIQGNKGDDTITAFGGDADTILGGQGNDAITGSTGACILDGNLGNDTISSRGSDQVFGEAGNDSLSGGFQSTLSGGDGADTLSGGGLVFGDDGNDSLNGASFGVVETLDGGAGDDHVFGGFFFGKALELGGLGNDTLGSGYVSQDTMDGGVGDDRLVSNAGSSVMLGGDGADDLFFAGGSNTMTGGAGADLFEAGAGVATLAGMDRITDWSREDSLHFNDLPAGGVAFFSTTAQDFAGALSAASQTIAQQNGVVAVQVGTDVIVFAGNASGQVDVAVDLVGRALTDILPSNIV